MSVEAPAIPIPFDMDDDEEKDPETGEGHPAEEAEERSDDAKDFVAEVFPLTGRPSVAPEAPASTAIVPQQLAGGMLAIPRPSDLRALSADQFTETNGQLNEFDAQYRRFRAAMRLEFERRANEDKLREIRSKITHAETILSRLRVQERQQEESLRNSEIKIEELEKK